MEITLSNRLYKLSLLSVLLYLLLRSKKMQCGITKVMNKNQVVIISRDINSNKSEATAIIPFAGQFTQRFLYNVITTVSAIELFYDSSVNLQKCCKVFCYFHFNFISNSIL